MAEKDPDPPGAARLAPTPLPALARLEVVRQDGRRHDLDVERRVGLQPRSDHRQVEDERGQMLVTQRLGFSQHAGHGLVEVVIRLPEVVE